RRVVVQAVDDGARGRDAAAGLRREREGVGGGERRADAREGGGLCRQGGSTPHDAAIDSRGSRVENRKPPTFRTNRARRRAGQRTRSSEAARVERGLRTRCAARPEAGSTDEASSPKMKRPASMRAFGGGVIRGRKVRWPWGA